MTTEHLTSTEMVTLPVGIGLTEKTSQVSPRRVSPSSIRGDRFLCIIVSSLGNVPLGLADGSIYSPRTLKNHNNAMAKIVYCRKICLVQERALNNQLH